VIGPEHLPEGSARPEEPRSRRRVAVVTGTRAEFGLLRPVMKAIAARDDLELAVIAAGAHLISPADTFREVKASFAIAEIVPMQIAGRTGRAEDAAALARGIGRFTRAFERLRPDWVLVLGDRIEAFGAACAAAVGGWALAHMHGGDRAEGVADESMRHAISKLANLHLAATSASGERLIKMGEKPEHVHVVGSPAMDELAGIRAMSEVDFAAMGAPTAVLLLHPIGRTAEVEEAMASAVLESLAGDRVLALHPNFDPGREGIIRAIESAATTKPAAGNVDIRGHLPREVFVSLLRRLAANRGVLVGNSSAGLIEGAALGVGVVDIGPRQGGRERYSNVVHADTPEGVRDAVKKARAVDPAGVKHGYGDGRTGERAAALLATVSPHDPALLRKRNTY
jgi:UDP-hydrolysing UDP-N-acetyl-D-glucosamine 2-epimerase